MATVEVFCNTQEQLLFHIDSESPPSLHCRFNRNSSSPGYDVPARSIKNSTAHCQCNPQIVDECTSASVVLPNGDQVPCQVSFTKTDEKSSVYKKLSFLDRYLFIWILVVMIAAVLLGNFVKDVKKAFQVSKIASVSLPIAVGLWIMMYPVLCKVRYELLGTMFTKGSLLKDLALSFLLNWIVCPAIMTGLAWAALPDLQGYRRGVILVGIARCIAMVLVWNDLAKGDGELCAVIVAFNSILQIALYGPLSLFYLEVVSRDTVIHIGAWKVAKSVLLFLGAPLAAGMMTRGVLCGSLGKRWYNTKFIPFISPFALLGLLYTIFVMFSVQAHQIIHNMDKVARVAVPLAAYFSIVFVLSVVICISLRIPYPRSVTQAFTASSNNFELAIAVAVGIFGIDSSEALAATIGPLMEVPILLGLVYVMLLLKPKYF